MKNKKAVITSIVVGILAFVGVGGYLIAKEFQHIEKNQNVKMENKLLIGTYQQSTLSNNDKCWNTLYVEVVDNGEVKLKKTMRTDDPLLKEDKNYPNCVFYDLSEEMKNYTDNLGIYFWGKQNVDKNYVSIRTECNGINTLSSEIKIADCGLYLVNIPTKTGEVPQVEHCYVYQNNKVGW